jgi:hypothetical protein
MQEIATFSILFIVYFLGILALVQLSIRPKRKLIQENPSHEKHWETNYFRIILLSFFLSLTTTILAFLLFP